MEIIASNLSSELHEGAILMLADPLNTNGGDFSAAESWAGLAHLVADGTIVVVINQDDIWLSRDPEQLNDGSTFMVLKPGR
jgi:hypothetical protein